MENQKSKKNIATLRPIHLAHRYRFNTYANEIARSALEEGNQSLIDRGIDDEEYKQYAEKQKEKWALLWSELDEKYSEKEESRKL